MEIGISLQGNKTIVSVQGRLDAVSSPEFDLRVTEEIEKGAKALVVDLAGLDYISSAGLRSMLTLAKSLKVKGGSLVLCGLRGVVKEVFEISGFTSIFTIVPSLEEALRVV